ncbi:MAG: type IV pilus twitching motility protein PilT [Myxococcota bacterium]|nr:type IV pilus twitching motility protein PilT [Myxococcota bacterium]
MKMHELLVHAVKVGASDIHLTGGEHPCLRIHGHIERMSELPKLDGETCKRLAYSIMNEKQRTTFENNMEVDFSIGLKNLARFRVNVFTHARGVGVVMRQIPSQVLTLEDIKAPPIFRRIAGYRKGLVLVCGPTGSGKSTTLAAIIDHINKNRQEHILTVEDPVEFVHQPIQCIVNQREVGAHTHSFSNALRSALREDPDVILVGELRDLETISLALTAAETGHLVFGTLHTNSAAETIDRLIDVFPHEQQSQVRTMLSASLMAIVNQALMRKKTGDGRIAAHEILIANPAIRNLIRENKLYQIQSILQTAKQDGMQTMEDCLKDLAMRRIINRKDAVEYTGNHKLFDDSDDPTRRRPAPGGRRY